MGLFSFLSDNFLDHSQPVAGGQVQGTFAPAQGRSEYLPMPGANGQDTYGAGSVGTLQQAPQMETKPGLLHQAWDWLKRPETLAMLGTGMRAAGGDENAFADQARMQETRLKSEQYQRQQALQSRGNQAFRAAYQNGRFDPNVYAQVMGDALDPSAMATLAKTVNPEQKLEGAFITEHDPVSGRTRIVGQRPADYGELTAQQQADEAHRHNTVDEGQGEQHIGIDRQRVGLEGAQLGVAQGQLGVAQQHLGLERQQAGRQPGPPLITNEADVARLKPGSPFIGPDGVLRYR